MLNYNQLYYFYVVARSGSITQGATELRIAQPSLSSQIKTLESKLGKKLFEKNGRGLRLSSEGEVVFGHCRRIYEAAEALEREIEKESLTETRLHVGVSVDIERPFLVEMISRLSESDVGISRVKMSSNSTGKLIGALKTDALDAAITGEPIFDPEISVLSGEKMPVMLAFNQNGRFKKLSMANLTNLRTLSQDLGIPWALPQKNMRLRRETDIFFEKCKLNPNIILESDVISTIVRAVADDLGVALLPKPYLRSYAKVEKMKAVGPNDGFWSHGIWLLGRKQRKHSKEQNLLKSVFHKTVS